MHFSAVEQSRDLNRGGWEAHAWTVVFLLHRKSVAPTIHWALSSLWWMNSVSAFPIMEWKVILCPKVLLFSTHPHSMFVMSDFLVCIYFPYALFLSSSKLVLSFGQDFQQMPHGIPPSNGYRPSIERPNNNRWEYKWENTHHLSSSPRICSSVLWMYRCWKGGGRYIRSIILSVWLA